MWLYPSVWRWDTIPPTVIPQHAIAVVTVAAAKAKENSTFVAATIVAVAVVTVAAATKSKEDGAFVAATIVAVAVVTVLLVPERYTTPRVVFPPRTTAMAGLRRLDAHDGKKKD